MWSSIKYAEWLRFALITLCFASNVLAIANGFDYPIPENQGWDICQDFLQSVDNNCNEIEGGAPPNGTHLGEDWNWGSRHDDVGLSVYSIADGTVIDSNKTSAWGNYIMIRHDLPSGHLYEYVVSFYAHLGNNRQVSINDPVLKGQEIGFIGAQDTNINGDYLPHLHFELRTNQFLREGRTDTTRGCGYTNGSNCNDTDFTGWIDPSDFIDSNRNILFTHFTFPKGSPQGWTPGWDTEEAPLPEQYNEWRVHVVNNPPTTNPGIISPEFSSGMMAKNTAIKFSAKVTGNDQPINAELYVKHKDGNWANSVSIGTIGTHHEYREYTVDLSQVVGDIPVEELELKQFSLELSDGDNGNNEYWYLDWVNIFPTKWDFSDSQAGWTIKQDANHTGFYPPPPNEIYWILDSTEKQPQIISPYLNKVASDYQKIVIRYSVEEINGTDEPFTRVYFDTGSGFSNACYSQSTITRNGHQQIVEFHLPPCAIGNTQKVMFDLFDSPDFPNRQIAIDKIFFLKCDGSDEPGFCDGDGGGGGGLYEPEDLTTTAISPNQIYLSWDIGLNPSEYQNLQYRIYRYNNPIATTSDTYYYDSGLNPNTQYCYKVSAFIGSDESSLSSESCATTQSNGNTSNYTFNRSTTCTDVDTSDPWLPHDEKSTFTEGEDVSLWFELNDLYTSVRARADYFLPDGSLYSTVNWDWTTDPDDAGWDYWEWYRFYADIVSVPNVGTCNSDTAQWEGQWTANIYIDSGSGYQLENTSHFNIQYTQSPQTYYRDADLDGYGDPNNFTRYCFQPSGYVQNNTDNCLTVYNPNQADADGDGVGNACDGDYVCLITVPDDYDTIQEAIANANDGCEIIVRAGTYDELIIFDGTKTLTVRSESGAAATIIDGSGLEGSVVSFAGGDTSTFEGFTATRGSGTDLYGGGHTLGGGVFCNSSSPRIANCTISWNSAASGGGILCYDHSSPLIDHCVVENNSAIDPGFQTEGGGIMCNNNSSPSITNSIIKNNSASHYGGGISSINSSSPQITSCIISLNTALFGGGISSSYPSLSLINCIITKNSANSGGGIRCNDSLVKITNCTISENSVKYYGAGIYSHNYSAVPVIVNSIIWDNIVTIYSNSSEIHLLQSGSTIDISFSDLNPSHITGNGSPILNNYISADPFFADPFNDNYRLQPNSESIGTGTDLGAVPTDDIDGVARPQGIGYDMGAYEYPCIDTDGDSYYDIEGCASDFDNCPDDVNEDQADIDGDGLGDVCDDDVDGDCLLNAIDPCPNDADCDDDGLPDGTCSPGEDLNNNGVVDQGECDPLNADSDGDGILDGTELGLTEPARPEHTDMSIFVPDADPTTQTDPTNPDTDGDGLLDGEEDTNQNGQVDDGETSPWNSDSDGDGVDDGYDALPLDSTETDDSDSDGVGDNTDNCPNDPDKTELGLCGCGTVDTDSDGDSTPDCNDACPNDSNKIEAGLCGCGVADTDSDDDNTPNCHDQCPDDSNKIESGECGCGIPDTDSDGDNIPDCNDTCPNDPNNDIDEDVVCGDIDNCPEMANPNQDDCDDDDIGDTCDSDYPCSASSGQATGSGYYYTGRYRTQVSVNVDSQDLAVGTLGYYNSRKRMSFSSTSIQSVDFPFDHTAVVTGEGTVNGINSYTFTATITGNVTDSWEMTIFDSSGNTYESGAGTLSRGDLVVTILEP